MQTNKIVFEDGTEFQSCEAPFEQDIPIFSRRQLLAGEVRENVRVTVIASYADVISKFIPGAHWVIRQFDMNENGEQLETYTDFDYSEYTVYGSIIDHRDGRITVYVGQKTESELTQEALDDLMLMSLGV